jgi:hypothetical protein
MKCNEGHEIQVLLSSDGYYIGTLDEAYEFNCKVSDSYFPLRSNAVKEFDRLKNMGKDCCKCY